jgi:hypothetical protein
MTYRLKNLSYRGQNIPDNYDIKSTILSGSTLKLHSSLWQSVMWSKAARYTPNATMGGDQHASDLVDGEIIITFPR